MSTSIRVKSAISAAVLVLTPLAVTSVAASPAQAAQGRKFANCTALARVYAHGVARSASAAQRQVDQGYGRPATSKRAKAVYKRNFRNLDRDRDGTACER